MKVDNIGTSPDKDTLQKQLTELNMRSRWYSSQLWHVPFAYLGITGLAITNATGWGLSHLPFVFWACSAFGIFVLWHMFGLRDGERRAVKNLQSIESELHLKRTAEYKPLNYVWPLQIVVILAVIVYTWAGIYFKN